MFFIFDMLTTSYFKPLLYLFVAIRHTSLSFAKIRKLIVSGVFPPIDQTVMPPSSRNLLPTSCTVPYLWLDALYMNPMPFISRIPFEVGGTFNVFNNATVARWYFSTGGALRLPFTCSNCPLCTSTVACAKLLLSLKL